MDPINISKCCIHFSGIEGEIKQFSADTLKKCKNVLKARIHHRLEHRFFQVPDNLNLLDGYHVKCYARFTALKSHYLNSLPYEVLSASISELISSLPSSCSEDARIPRTKRKPHVRQTGVLPKKCIFCKSMIIVHKSRKQPLIKTATRNFEHKVRDAAQSLSDFNLLATIGLDDFVSKEVHYHKICCARYISRSKRSKTSKTTDPKDWHNHRSNISRAFSYIFDFVKEHIIKNDEIFTSKELFKIYRQAFQDLSPETKVEEIKAYPLRKFEQKILNKYPTEVYINKVTAREHILFHSSMDYKKNVVENKMDEMRKHSILRDAAYELRKIIFSTEQYSFPNDNITVKDILKGECDVPLQVVNFFKDVINGPSYKENTVKTERRAVSMAQDLIFSSSQGRIKPTKHLSLGIALKSMTGSKKVLDVMNRLGHTASYSTIEEVETEMSYSSLNQNSFLPPTIIPASHLCTTLAFDNFDRFVDTATGKDTLHDTVAVVYQNDIPSQSDIQEPCCSFVAGPEPRKKRRRRAFDEILSEVEPYPKKPRRSFDVGLHFPGSDKGQKRKDYFAADMIWAASVAHDIPQTPMWVGFNSQLFSDDLPIQKVAYLPQINQSPTSYSVVAHTLKVAQVVANLCDQTGIICGYDLNIARLALQIQNEEIPKYDDIFIMLGPFHIELSLFKAFGKYLDGCGITDVLESVQLIARGSINGLLSGTHYNRCRRVYQLLALSMRILHYRQFASLYLTRHKTAADTGDKYNCEASAQPNNDVGGTSDHYYIDESHLINLLNESKNLKFGSNDELKFNSELEKYINEYRKYENITLQGGHGATGQFWMTFVKLFDVYHDFTRSVRMGNIYDFLKSLEAITDFFFAVNHQNYARWLVIFADKLAEAIDKDDDVGAQLRRGIFSVRRSKTNFSRTGLDLTLEQTINADAGNKLTGITSFTNSISARQRWAVSHSQRTEITTNMMESVGLKKKEDVTQDLLPSNITAKKKMVDKLIEGIQNCLNPFSPTLDSNNLFNICTGISAKEATKNCLLNLCPTGKVQHKNFRRECSTNSERFYQPIKRNSVLNFASENIKLKIKNKDIVKELKQERNLFARLLTISLEKKIDLRTVMAYPLTPTPLSLCHSNGIKLSTPKSTLLHHIEKVCSHDWPRQQDVIIIDGFYFMYSVAKILPSSYGQIAHAILKKLGAMKAKSIHIVFDKYISPSIKDIERASRAETSINQATSFNIENPSQKRSGDITKLLKIDSFKEALVDFLIQEWQKPEYCPYFRNFTLFANKHDTCYQFYHHNEIVVTTEAHLFSNSHIEADSKIAYITTKLSDCNVVIKTSDTDILVIILGNIHHVPKGVRIWLETGTISRNDRRFINIHNIAESLGQLMCKSLIALHAITGNDYTASFYRLGKIKPFKVIQSNPKYQESLSRFGENYNISDEENCQIERIVCNFYSKTNICDINELKLLMFMDAFNKSNKQSRPLSVSKGIDAAQFPPCKRVLYMKCLRAKFVTVMWSSISSPNPPALCPTNYGWKLENDCYQILWFTGQALPETLEEILFHSENNLSNENEDEFAVEEQSDSESDCSEHEDG